MSARWSGSEIWSRSSKRRSAKARPSSYRPATNSAMPLTSHACERSSTSPSRSAMALASRAWPEPVERVPEPLRDQRACPGHAVGRRQPERRLDPLVDHRVVGHPPPHARARGRLVGELAVELGLRLHVRAELDRVPHGVPEPLPVVLERVGAPQRAPQLDSELGRLCELERALVERDRLVELVAGDRELGRAPEPDDRAGPETLELLLVALPREVGVLGLNGLGVVVGEERRLLVPALRRLAPARPRSRRAAARAGPSAGSRRRPRA